MKGTRIVACVAAALAATAYSSSATAQFCAVVGSPQPFPPCLTFSPQNAIQEITKLKTKADELQEQANQIKGMTDIQSAIGLKGAINIPTLPPLVSIAPLPTTSFGDASKTLRSAVGSGSTNGADFAVRRDAELLNLRSAAGDAYSIAMATKSRFAGMDKDAADLAAQATAGTDNIRTDWAINSKARSLILRAIAARQEVDAAQLMLSYAKVMSGTGMLTASSSTVLSQGDATHVAAAPAPSYSDSIGQISNLSSYLASLVTAKQMLGTFNATLQGSQDAQAEYQSILANAQQTTAAMNNFANSQGKRGVSGQTMLARADAIMASMDHTTWDDPSKTQVAAQAATYAKSQLDKMVKGGVSNSWITNLENQAEALKQEAYFRQFNADAKSLQADTLATMAEYGKPLNVSMTEPASIDAAIAATQAKLADTGKSLDSAPDAVKAQRDAIYNAAMQNAGLATTT